MSTNDLERKRRSMDTLKGSKEDKKTDDRKPARKLSKEEKQPKKRKKWARA